MKLPLAVSPFLLFAHGCSGKSTAAGDETDGTSGSDSSPDLDDSTPEEVVAEPLFEVTGGPFDLTIAPDGRVFASIEEHAIDVWDPETGWVETHTDRAGPVFGIHWASDTLWYTTSNHRQAGALMRLDGRTGEVIAQSAGSTLFREPRDLCQAADGAWILADATVGALFSVRDEGSAVELIDVPLSDVSTVTADADHVYAGGDDGVVQISWPDGLPATIDDRPVDGLHIAAGVLWGTNTEWGVFEVGGNRRLELPDLRRPGRMTGSDPLLVTDTAAGHVWAVSLSDLD